MSAPRGQWVVVIRDVPANEDTLIGPFHTGEKAMVVARRFTRDFAARGASDVMEAVAKWVRPGVEVTDLRDELLAGLEEGGYELVRPERRLRLRAAQRCAEERGAGFNPDVSF